MTLTNLLRAAFATTPRPKARRRLRLEALEARDNPSGGLLDTTFGPSNTGIVTTPVGSASDQAYGLLVQPDGKIVASGYAGGASATDFAAVRYTAVGALDPSFGNGGKVITKVGGYSAAWTSALQPDGKILLGGFSQKTWNADRDFTIVRYNVNGSLDNSFGLKGKVVTDFSGQTDYITVLTVQADGKIVAGGMSRLRGSSLNGYSLGLARYNATGSLDATFGTGGKVVTHLAGSWDQVVTGIALQADGKIVVAALAANGPSLDPNRPTGEEFLLTRFTSTGRLDTDTLTGFGPLDPITGRRLGYVLQDLGAAADDSTGGLLIQPADGKIVVGGKGAGHQFVAVRYNPDGSRDTSFGPSGTGIASADPVPGTGGGGGAIALRPDGKMVVGGNAGGQFALARFNADGTLDSGFGTNGTVATLIASRSSANAMAIQPWDGKIIFAGFAQVGSTDDFALARYWGGEPQAGSFTAGPSPIAASIPVTLAASVTAGTRGSPGAVAQVPVYADSVLDPATDALLGYATYDAGSGRWRLTISTAGSAAGTYRLFVRDGYGADGDPLALNLEVL